LHKKKFYITGGSSAAHHTITPYGDIVHEAFGNTYELPNATASNENCSHIGDAMWNWRMFCLTEDLKYVDIIEEILYNSFLAGMGLEGKTYFYTNPLRRFGAEGVFLTDDTMIRWMHREGFCCPPNIIRMIAKLHSWVYSISTKGIWINLYGGNKLDTKLPDGSLLKLTQETDYPWDGKIKISIDEVEKEQFSVMLRIPAWAEQEEVILKINGKVVQENIQSGEYFELKRIWSAGDIIQLELPMPSQLIEANPLVEQCFNQVAVKRGPVIYCLESPDLPNGISISEVVIPGNIEFRPMHKKAFLGGVTVLQGEASYISKDDWQQKLYRSIKTPHLESIDVQLIPYYTWANRGISEMSVWMSLAY